MNKVIIGILILLAGGALFFGGLFLGLANSAGFPNSWMMGRSHWGPAFMDRGADYTECPYRTADGKMSSGFGMMGQSGMMGSGYGVMHGDYGRLREHGMVGGGNGMMHGGYGMMGSGRGMMGGYRHNYRSDGDPLSIEATKTAVADYLASLGRDDLAVGEIMIFDNHAYAQVIDTGSDTGAFEVLVDPVSLVVYPEPGPNMMWNTEYGHMYGTGNSGGMAGMMGSSMMGDYRSDTVIDVTGQEAITIAQQYLDRYFSGTTADGIADVFPGYYTIHVLSDGETIGMLSVNSYTGQVFLHHWHGGFIEMAADTHD